MKTNYDSSDDDDDNLSGPVSVDEYLDQAGPVSVDDYLDPETEAKADHLAALMTVTQSLKSVLSAATEMAQRVRSENREERITAVREESEPVAQRVPEKRKVDYDKSESKPEECRLAKKSKNDDYQSDTKDNNTGEDTGETVSEVEAGSNRSDVIVQGRPVQAPQGEQEWTYQDLVTSMERSMEQRQDDRQRDREEKRKEKYETAERARIAKVMYFGVFCLVLEVVAASIAVEKHQPLVECCDRSIFSENEAVGERWNKAFYLIGILFIPFIILIEIPTLIIAQETLFLFNPMVGYLLAMQMLYTTDIESAFVIFGLECAAMLGQSWVLAQMRRSPESCLHSIVNYTMCAITVYMLVMLTKQGGFCIVGDRIQSIFADQTCNVDCIDEDSCFRCTAGGKDDESFTPECFVQFPTSEGGIEEILSDEP